jgi:hypothetical protein
MLALLLFPMNDHAGLRQSESQESADGIEGYQSIRHTIEKDENDIC